MVQVAQVTAVKLLMNLPQHSHGYFYLLVKKSHKTSQDSRGREGYEIGHIGHEYREAWAHWGTTKGRKDNNVYILASTEVSKQQRKRMK